jgi:hypothetical protein
MTLDEITKRVVPKEGLGLDEKFETVEVRFAKKYKQKPVKVDVTPEAIWRRALYAALDQAMKPLRRRGGKSISKDQYLAFKAWERLERTEASQKSQAHPKGATTQQLRETHLGSLRPKVRSKAANLLKPKFTLTLRIYIAYANMLCEKKRVPFVQEIREEVGGELGELTKLNKDSTIRKACKLARLPLQRRGRPR